MNGDRRSTSHASPPPRVQLGTTPLEVTRIGLGSWAMGGGDCQGGWGTQDDKSSVATIHRAIECGINWIDTAPAYGFGRSEEIVGAALRRYADVDRPFVFTKCGLVWEGDARTVHNDLSPESIRRECEQSLRRLGVDVIDLLHAHWPTWDDTPVERSWEAMATLVDEGRVRHIGLSNFSASDLARCEAIRHVDCFQPELNMLSRGVAEESLPWCLDHGTGVLVYSPMRSGLLSGRFHSARAAALPSDDWRSQCDDFVEPKLSANLAAVDALQPIAADAGLTIAELAIAWTLAWPGVTAAIVGARSPLQLDDWIGAAGAELDDEALSRIGSVLDDAGAGTGPLRPGSVAA